MSVPVAGAGINIAQRVMDCGGAGHILVSKRTANDLGQYGRWQPDLHDLGEVEVKHGLRLGVVNFHGENFWNAALTEWLGLALFSATPNRHAAAKQAERGGQLRWCRQTTQ